MPSVARQKQTDLKPGVPRMIHVSLYLEEDLFNRLRDVANAINRASRQDIIRAALHKELKSLENRLGAGERIIIRRSMPEFVPADFSQ